MRSHGGGSGPAGNDHTIAAVCSIDVSQWKAGVDPMYAAVTIMAEEVWALMKEIAELRGQVGENLPAFKDEICKLQFVDATNGKMKHLLAHQ